MQTTTTTVLWRYNHVIGYWAYVRNCDLDTAQQWLRTFESDEPTAAFRLAQKKPTRPPQALHAA